MKEDEKCNGKCGDNCCLGDINKPCCKKNKQKDKKEGK